MTAPVRTDQIGGTLGTGPLLAIGGRFEDDNDALFDAIISLSGGDTLVFPTASGFPDEVGSSMVDDLRRRGGGAESADLTMANAGERAFDPELVARIGRCGGVYFTGGDQLQIYRSLVQGGQETPVLAALRALQARGGLIAGSSAGAAMQSDPMLLGGSSLDSLTTGLVDDPDTAGLSLGPGLGFFRFGLIDQHFLERGRIGRLVAGLLETGQRFGFGVDENTGMLVRDGMVEVIGETGLVVVDMKQARRDRGANEVSDIRVSFLDAGDRFDLRTGRGLPGPAKRLLRPGRAGAFHSPAAMPRDVFGAYALHEIWQRLALGDPRVYDREQVSVADPRNGRRVTLSLRRRPRVSLAYRDPAGRLTLLKFLLAVTVSAEPECAEPQQPPETLPAAAPADSLRPDPVPAGRLPGVLAQPLIAPKPGSGRVRIAGPGAAFAGKAFGVRFRRTGDPVFHSLPDGKPRAGAAGMARLASARQIVLDTPLRDHITHRITRLGESAPVRDALRAALGSGATIFAADEAAAASGTEVITYGDASAAIRWGVSSDAGVEGVVVEPGLGLVPGIVHPGVGQGGIGIGRLLVACAERQLVGWGLQAATELALDTATGQMTQMAGPPGVQVWVERDKVRSTREVLDIRDIHIAPVQPADPGAQATGAHAMILDLIEGFAREIGAPRETSGDGISWMGEDVLLRAHMRAGGACSLDISCHRARMTAQIR